MANMPCFPGFIYALFNENAQISFDNMREHFRNKFFICLIMTVPIFLLTFMVEGGYWLNGKYFFHGNVYIVFMLSSFVYFYGVYPFLKGVFSGKMKLVVVIADTAAYFYSVLVLFDAIQSTIVLFWELVVFTDIMLLGFWIGTKKT